MEGYNNLHLYSSYPVLANCLEIHITLRLKHPVSRMVGQSDDQSVGRSSCYTHML